jgi:hypothetical protein
MAKPWEKYGTQSAGGPWQKYASQEQAAHAAPESSGNIATDALRGIGAGVISTGVGAYDLARKVAPSLPEVSPYWRGATEAPDSLAGKAGKFAEQTAEFLMPGMAASKALKAAPLLGRVAGEAALAGGVAGIQSGGDPAAAGTAAALGAAGPLVGAGVQAVGKSKIPERLYQSALKPTWSMEKKAGEELVKTGLEMGVPVSSKGLQALEGKIADTTKRISAAIKDHGKQGAAVDTGKVLGALGELEQFYKNTPGGEAGVQAINEMVDWFANRNMNQIPIEQAQQMKVNMYRLLKKSYGDFKGAKVETLKGTARGIKEQIEQVFPEIASLNAEQSKRLNLDEALYRAVWRIDNQQAMGLGTPMAASAGHAMLGGPGAITGLLSKAVLDDPAIKSKIAIALARAGNKNAPKTLDRGLSALRASLQASASQD